MYVYVIVSNNCFCVLDVLPSRAVATAHFAQQVNDIFDSVNGSRSVQPRDGGNVLRCKATKTSGHGDYWSNAVQNVRNWQFERRTKSGLLLMPPSQKGWIATLSSFKTIWSFLQEK